MIVIMSEYRYSFDHKLCVLCNEFGISEYMVETRCHHFFHENCLKYGFEENIISEDECPVCNQWFEPLTFSILCRPLSFISSSAHTSSSFGPAAQTILTPFKKEPLVSESLE